MTGQKHRRVKLVAHNCIHKCPVHIADRRAEQHLIISLRLAVSYSLKDELLIIFCLLLALTKYFSFILLFPLDKIIRFVYHGNKKYTETVSNN